MLPIETGTRAPQAPPWSQLGVSESFSFSCTSSSSSVSHRSCWQEINTAQASRRKHRPEPTNIWVSFGRNRWISLVGSRSTRNPPPSSSKKKHNWTPMPTASTNKNALRPPGAFDGFRPSRGAASWEVTGLGELFVDKLWPWTSTWRRPLEDSKSSRRSMGGKKTSVFWNQGGLKPGVEVSTFSRKMEPWQGVFGLSGLGNRLLWRHGRFRNRKYH